MQRDGWIRGGGVVRWQVSCHVMPCNAKVPRITASVCVDEKERDGEKFLKGWRLWIAGG